MEARRQGTFAISWAETEIDGLADAPVEELTVGASWSWNGRAIRVDGPQDLLVLDAAHGASELRDRAARRSARLPGVGTGLPPNAGDGRLDPDGALRDGFTVTDGRRQFPVAILRDPRRQRTLLAFPEAIPPPRTELWVTAHTELSPAPSGLRSPGVICFAEGTRLRTPDGDRPVESLRPGDRVITRDDGAQEVVWTGSTHLTGARLHVQRELRPIRIRAAALGGAVPEAELLVSPQHRVLVRGPATQALFNTDEVLVRAADLVDDRAIAPVRALRRLTYHHLMLARHQVLWANGVPSESFHPADAALSHLQDSQRDRLFRLFPEIERDPGSYGAPVRRLLSRAETAILLHDMPQARRRLH